MLCTTSSCSDATSPIKCQKRAKISRRGSVERCVQMEDIRSCTAGEGKISVLRSGDNVRMRLACRDSNMVMFLLPLPLSPQECT